MSQTAASTATGTATGTETISDQEMQHLKKLARLKLSPDETEHVRSELNQLLGYFAVLQQLDTECLPEMPRPVALENVMRPDIASEPLTQAQALAVGVATEQGFFKVPRIVEG
jgi:aspartyl-tRNA(Asn)/glutamyl-tRNA(Gln) amidotransferase subunit C